MHRESRLKIAAFVVLALLCVGAGYLLLAQAGDKAVAAATLNEIQREDANPGTTSWEITNPATRSSNNESYLQIEGYAWRNSPAPGETNTFSVSTTDPSFRADVYRLGWYGGKGARLMASITNIAGHHYAIPAANASTGLLTCNWPASFTLHIGSNWVTGLYLVKLTGSVSGKQIYIPFTLRPANGQSPSALLFLNSVNTDEAYNTWGGKSLYQLNGTGSQAAEVSFDRPYLQNDGLGRDFSWTYPMIRWLEKNGYDVSYFTDVDVHNDPSRFLGHKGILLVGHSEYWSQNMYDGLENAVNSGVSLGNFAADSIYWQMRYAGSPQQPNAMRVVICYKYKPGTGVPADPLYNSSNRSTWSLATVEWRSTMLRRPEQTLLGSQYISYFHNPGYAWVVNDPNNWIFAGTGVRKGSKLEGLEGYEVDAMSSAFPHPANDDTVASSPIIDVDGNPMTASATAYTAGSGARVVNVGTVQWSWGLDSFNTPYTSPGTPTYHYVRNPISMSSQTAIWAQGITTNILRNFLLGTAAHAVKVHSANASGNLSDAAPAMAVDGNAATAWNAGNKAPQWIELNLGAQYTLTQLRLLTQQSPSGGTTHTIYAGSSPDPTKAIATLSGNTADSQWITRTFLSIAKVQYIRIKTTISPSWVAWREIQVYGLASTRQIPGSGAPIVTPDDDFSPPAIATKPKAAHRAPSKGKSVTTTPGSTQANSVTTGNSMSPKETPTDAMIMAATVTGWVVVGTVLPYALPTLPVLFIVLSHL